MTVKKLHEHRKDPWALKSSTSMEKFHEQVKVL